MMKLRMSLLRLEKSMRWRNSGGYDRGDQRAADTAMVRNPALMMGLSDAALPVWKKEIASIPRVQQHCQLRLLHSSTAVERPYLFPCVHGMAWSDCDIIVFHHIQNAQGE